MHKVIVFAALAVLCGVHSAAIGRGVAAGDAAIARDATPAVVNISAWQTREPAAAGGTPRRVKVYGSGFIIDRTGIIVTNRHVVDGSVDLTAIFNNGDRASARLIAAAAVLDLAVLKVDVDRPLPSLKWGDSDALDVGDPVLAIGNPLGIGLSVSSGVVSALNRDLHDTPFDSYIQTDAAINHGNSGGPLVNQVAEVIGIDTALYNPEEQGGSIGIGFAIPSNTAKFVVDRLLDPNHPKPAWLGAVLQDISQPLAKAIGLPTATGAIISEVDPDGPAGRASMRPGDVLEKLNGVQLNDSRAFMRAIVVAPIGQSVQVTAWRKGQERELTVTLAEWPNHLPRRGTTTAKTDASDVPDIGITVDEITDAARRRYRLDPQLAGALVSAVESDSEAQHLGVVPGDVITATQSESVTTAGDFRRVVREAEAQRHPRLAVLIQTKNGARWIPLSLDRGDP
jgi:serine protease Do